MICSFGQPAYAPAVFSSLRLDAPVVIVNAKRLHLNENEGRMARSCSRCDAGCVLTSWCSAFSFLYMDKMRCQSSAWHYLLFTAQKDIDGERGESGQLPVLHNTRCKQSTSLLLDNNNHRLLAAPLLL